MKRILFCLLLCAGCLYAHALIPYSIYEWEGDVLYKGEKDNQWKPVVKGVKLIISDSIRISKGSYVWLVDQDRHEKIKSLSDGVLSIGNIVEKAHNADSKNILAGIHDELKKKNMMNNNPCSMTVKGATLREISGSNSIKMLARNFAWIGKLAVERRLNHPTEGFVLHKREVSGELSFAIENSTMEKYCVNVLHINKETGIISLCFVISRADSSYINILPNCCYAFSRLTFPNTENDVYVLVATTEPYNSEALDDELYYHKISAAKAEDEKINILYSL